MQLFKKWFSQTKAEPKEKPKREEVNIELLLHRFEQAIVYFRRNKLDFDILYSLEIDEDINSSAVNKAKWGVFEYLKIFQNDYVRVIDIYNTQLTGVFLKSEYLGFLVGAYTTPAASRTRGEFKSQKIELAKDLNPEDRDEFFKQLLSFCEDELTTPEYLEMILLLPPFCHEARVKLDYIVKSGIISNHKWIWGTPNNKIKESTLHDRAYRAWMDM